MSEWAYRDCDKCGDRTHMGFKCSCGGDPWGIKIEAQDELRRVNERTKSLKKQLSNWKDRKKALREKIK